MHPDSSIAASYASCQLFGLCELSSWSPQFRRQRRLLHDLHEHVTDLLRYRATNHLQYIPAAPLRTLLRHHLHHHGPVRRKLRHVGPVIIVAGPSPSIIRQRLYQDIVGMTHPQHVIEIDLGAIFEARRRLMPSVGRGAPRQGA